MACEATFSCIRRAPRRLKGRYRHFLHWLMVDFHAIRSLRTRLSRAGLHSRHAQQVVRGPNHIGRKLGLHDSDEAALSQSADRLHPAEDLLDALALSLADRVALVPRGPAIEPRRPATLDP